MTTYCIATYCPIADSCQICKVQTYTDTDSYNNFSGNLIATLQGWQCADYVPTRISHYCSSTTE